MPQVNHERLAGRFARPEAFLGGLDVSTAAQLVASSADVVLLLDEKGVIRDISLGTSHTKELGELRQWLAEFHHLSMADEFDDEEEDVDNSSKKKKNVIIFNL